LYCRRFLSVTIRQGETGHGERLPTGKRGIVNGHVTAAARCRYRALNMRRRAVAGVHSEMSRRACGVGAGIFHVPDFALLPDDAAAIQSDGRVSVANTVPLSDVATFAGAAPVRIFSTALVPIVVSMASSRALRTPTEN
jgi:hypothetical protein